MTPLVALTYSFLFGLLHGILPDEHMWPITLSYAIGGASGRAGMKAGLYFSVAAPPAHWTIIHGFIAGFGFGGFSLFINTVAAPAMSSPWLGFLPGLVYGMGTMVVLVIIGALFGASLRWTHALTKQEIKQVGSRVGGRTLLLGGLLFTAFGIADFLGVARLLPVDPGYVLIGLFMVVIAIPALAYSSREVLTARDRTNSGPEASQHASTLPTKHHV